jgi:DNA-binding NtrC family response regulator
VDLVNFDGLSLLVIGESPDERGRVERVLARLGITHVRHAANAAAAVAILADAGAPVDVVIHGLQMADADNTALKHALSTRPHPPVIVLFGTNTDFRDVVPMSAVRHFAHEAAAPLMIVTMLAEMLLDDIAVPPAHADDVRKIQRAAGELSQMIKTLRTR